LKESNVCVVATEHTYIITISLNKAVSKGSVMHGHVKSKQFKHDQCGRKGPIRGVGGNKDFDGNWIATPFRAVSYSLEDGRVSLI